MAAPSKTEGLRSASAAALRSARDKLAAGFESPTGVLAQQRLSYSPVALGAGVETTTDDPSDGQGSSAPPVSRRPPSSGSNVLPDQQRAARAHAQNWLQGAMTMATSPLVPRPAADPNDPGEKHRIAAITAREHAVILREHDAEVEKTKQDSRARIKRSTVFLHERGYHV